VYIKEHQSKEAAASGARDGQAKSGTKGRTLFVGNIDYRLSMTEDDLNGYLRLLFSRFGDIIDIYISALPEPVPSSDRRTNHINTRYAHINFSKKSSLKLALTASDTDYDAACREVTENYGLELKPKKSSDIKKMFAFIDQDADQLQMQVDSYMKSFEEQEIIQLKQREEQLTKPDDDGFMTVTHRYHSFIHSFNHTYQKYSEQHCKHHMNPYLYLTRKKRKITDSEDASSHKSRSGSGKKKQKKHTELTNFYHYQLKQQRVQDLDNLRKKFAEDKEKVSRLKEQRKFKPF
jgi:ribosomal RNA-processing protein 7